jgi:hypothetical protein
MPLAASASARPRPWSPLRRASQLAANSEAAVKLLTAWTIPTRRTD